MRPRFLNQKLGKCNTRSAQLQKGKALISQAAGGSKRAFSHRDATSSKPPGKSG
jgi:hypothetical protein